MTPPLSARSSGDWYVPVGARVAHFFKIGHTSCLCYGYSSRNRRAEPSRKQCKECRRRIAS